MFGGADFAAEMGAQMSWEALLFARSHLLLAAKALGLDAIDVPCLNAADLDIVAAETARVLALGFTCKSAIHPAQLAPIHAQFQPSDEDVQQARRIVEAAEQAQGGVVLVDGAMVDRPVVLSAQRTLALAGGQEAVRG